MIIETALFWSRQDLLPIFRVGCLIVVFQRFQELTQQGSDSMFTVI